MVRLDNSVRPFVSSVRILFGLLPGLGALIVLRMSIHLYRQDIEDADHRVEDIHFNDINDYYDFIIIGGGSAGSVLANRLSENSNWKVLLLEAGPNEKVLADVPALFPVLQTSSIDWQFETEPSDEYCLSMVDKKCKWPRGRVLGGSSAINAMLYIRGNKKDYDNWAQMGNAGWSYEEILPYFLKAEDMKIPEYQDDPFHKTGGPLTIENFRYEHVITRKILEAGAQMGYPIRDVNGKYQTGFTRSHATVHDGLRCSTAKAYLRPAGNRSNLHISVHSFVEKILIDENRIAYAVKFFQKEKSKIVRVKKEVLLSAGAIQSPQLLMLSGVGDSAHLKDVGIHTIANLPGVGKNLQDHVAMGGQSFLFDNPFKNGTNYCFNMKTAFTVDTLMDFSIYKKGQLYSMMEAEAMAFVNSKYQNPQEDYPDIQLFIAPTADNLDGGLFGKRANGITDETYAALYEDILYESAFSIVPLLLRPKSRGIVKLRDSNPNSKPLIYPKYFSNTDDIKILVEGAKIVQVLVGQPALRELNARPNPHRNPGCLKHSPMSDDYLECQARHHSLTIYHPVGTCAMGPEDNPEAVVDPRLRVYGIKGLRVVDSSVMPTITNGNTNAPTIMIAEKAAHMIKQDWAEVTHLKHFYRTENNRKSARPDQDGPERISLNFLLNPDYYAEVKEMFNTSITEEMTKIQDTNSRNTPKTSMAHTGNKDKTAHNNSMSLKLQGEIGFYNQESTHPSDLINSEFNHGIVNISNSNLKDNLSSPLEDISNREIFNYSSTLAPDQGFLNITKHESFNYESATISNNDNLNKSNQMVSNKLIDDTGNFSLVLVNEPNNESINIPKHKFVNLLDLPFEKPNLPYPYNSIINKEKYIPVNSISTDYLQANSISNQDLPAREDDSDGEVVYLHRDESVPCKDNKKCKVWLYYNGVRYEVEL